MKKGNAFKWAPIVLALAATGTGEATEAASMAGCSSEAFTTGGLARGDGVGVWVPSDFRVAFDCAALTEGAPDPAPVHALFNTLFGFEAKFPLPAGRFEVDTTRRRPLYQFFPDRPEAFGQWWRSQAGRQGNPS